MNRDVERVQTAIRKAGGHPLLVGGYVRDMLMGIDSKDVDIEVYGLEPDAVLDALRHVGAVKEAGRSFGVFKIHTGDTDMDVSLPRTESKAGSGHRGFKVIPDGALGYREASARRDFTINAIMFDMESGQFIDLHDGIRDIKSRILRHTSEAFADDPLRVLRGVQFAARFGFTMAEATVNLCADLKGEYSTLSLERIWGEFEKIGRRGVHIVKAMETLERVDWIGHFPELCITTGEYLADQAAAYADVIGFRGEDRLVIVFAALLMDLPDELVRSFLERIGCPEHVIRRVQPLVREAYTVADKPTPARVRQLARRLHPATIAELYSIYPSLTWYAEAVRLDVVTGPARPLLTGNDLIAEGHTPGPVFKTVLSEALKAQDAGEFDTREGALRWLRS